MSTTTIKLTNPTDNELSAAVAEYVAKLPVRDDARISAPNGAKVICHNEEYGVCSEMIPYSTSADAVLPLLEKCRYITSADFVPSQNRWCVGIGGDSGTAPTFPRAACIALLRANGIEVETTAKPTRASS